MNRRSAALGLLLAVLVLCGCAAHAAFPPIWPMPQSYTSGAETVVIDGAKMRLASACGASDDLTAAFDRFVQRTFTHRAAPLGEDVAAVSVVGVCARNVSAPLQLDISESYRLSASADGIMVDCEEVYGCYHGLETLSQMISFNYSTRRYELHHAPWRVEDHPRFPHRGVLVDTSRHFIPMPVLKRVIDSLTYAKLNVLHWHITDGNSFPMESTKYPQLAEHGAYSPAERYSIEDMKDVRDYARARGVRVMMEFDVPSHCAAMCKGMPELCPVPECSLENHNAWVLDITKQNTQRVVEDLFREIAELFPEQMIHMGGDEVEAVCLQENPFIVDWLEEHQMTVHDILQNFTKGIEIFIAERLKHVVVGWEEIWTTFGTKLNKNTVVQHWHSEYTLEFLKNVTSHGYRTLVSPYHNWYLDLIDTKWEKAYNFEPCEGLTDDECKLVLGGEGCQWTELVDSSVIMNTIWPRAAAIAERLWSPREVKSVEAAEGRYAGFRCIMNQRGIGAAPAFNRNARSAPPHPGSCYAQ